jgi:hypothetical protein
LVLGWTGVNTYDDGWSEYEEKREGKVVYFEESKEEVVNYY